MDQIRLTHLRQLEAESIHIIREVAAEFSNPVMLYSIGKDSSVMLHLARKAFYPGTLPFPLLHVDTGWKFREMYEFRDRTAADDQSEYFCRHRRYHRSENAAGFYVVAQSSRLRRRLHWRFVVQVRCSS